VEMSKGAGDCWACGRGERFVGDGLMILGESFGGRAVWPKQSY
jgi:hypothetical protein